MATDTRSRILTATNELFSRQGLTGTGLKQIGQRAAATIGSIYHFFPGGKTQLADEVIRTSGRAFGEHAMSIFAAEPDLPTAIDVAFRAAAANLVAVDYADACPIETIALEVASTDETLRAACADVFTEWIDDGVRQFAGSGLPSEVCRRLVIAFVNSLEGAFVLSRALRSPEPLEASGRAMVLAVRAELAEHQQLAGPASVQP